MTKVYNVTTADGEDVWWCFPACCDEFLLSESCGSIHKADIPVSESQRKMASQVYTWEVL